MSSCGTLEIIEPADCQSDSDCGPNEMCDGDECVPIPFDSQDVAITDCSTTDSVGEGGRANFTATVENDNAQPANVEVTAQVAGTTVASTSGTVAPNGSTELSASASYHTLTSAAGEGDHSVEILLSAANQGAPVRRTSGGGPIGGVGAYE